MAPRMYDKLPTNNIFEDVFSKFEMPSARANANSIGILPGTWEGKNGGIMKGGGLLSPALQGFSAFTNWNQGNKMLDLQEESFDFAQDKFWTNALMQRGMYENQLNRSNKNMAQSAFGPQGATWEQMNQLNNTYSGQDGVVGIDGVNQGHVFDAPDGRDNTNNISGTGVDINGNQIQSPAAAPTVTAQPAVGAAKALAGVPANGGRPGSAFAKGSVQGSGVPPKKILA